MQPPVHIDGLTYLWRGASSLFFPMRFYFVIIFSLRLLYNSNSFCLEVFYR